nr:unnamed protein product [Spirometra erinaceieuropaei]
MDSVDSAACDELEIVGYRRSIAYSVATYLAVLASGFSLALIFYWRPDIHLRLTHRRTVYAEAEKVLLMSKLGQRDVRVVFVHYLWSDRIVRYKHKPSHVGASEDSHLAEDSYIDGLPTTVRYFVYRSLKYVWNAEAGEFASQRGLDHSNCTHLVQAKPVDESHIDYLLAYYGPNVLEIPLTPICTKIFTEILTPFYLFQVFSVALWMSSEYYVFASIILLFSVSSISLTVFSCRRNERELMKKVAMAEEALALRSNSETPCHVPSASLVPGDVVCIPKTGCEMTADVLLLSGDCIVNESALTGESFPQAKSALREVASDEILDLRSHARHIIFSGTTVLQARLDSAAPAGEAWVRALVLRTGFLTSKGGLVRSILYPKPLDVNFTIDAFRFLSVMSIIAIAGSIYTWIILAHHDYNYSVLMKKSLDILTIVVPPALPAVMTTGLFLAQLRLKKHGIFCINPSAINIAGTLNTIVFDKTGTLTEDEMSVKGIWRSGIQPIEVEEFYEQPYLLEPSTSHVDEAIRLTDPLEVASQPSPLAALLASCHSLGLACLEDGQNPQLVGDPLDITIFKSTQWVMREASLEDSESLFKVPVKFVIQSPQRSSADVNPWHILGILRQFPFASAKQRQTVVVQSAVGPPFSPHDPTAGVISVFCKGSPEALQKLCRPDTLPARFDTALCHFTGQGYRVLALAWKPLGRSTEKLHSPDELRIGYNAWELEYHALRREDFESDLIFLGLIVLDNPIKPQSVPTIEELTRAKFQIRMATGDDLRTGLSVARQCGIIGAFDEVLQVSLGDSQTAKIDGSPPPGTEPITSYAGVEESLSCSFSSAAGAAAPFLKIDVLAPTLESTPSARRNSGGVLARTFLETTGHSLRQFFCGSSHNYSFEDQRNILECDAYSAETSEGDPGRSDSGDSEAYDSDDCELAVRKQHLVMTGEVWNLIRTKAPKLIPTVVAHGTVFARFLPDDKTSLISAMQATGYRVGMCGDGANDCGALKTASVGIALSDCEASIAAPFTSRQQDISCVVKLLKEGRCSLSTAIGSFKYMTLYSFVQFFSVLILYFIGNVLTDADFLIIDLFFVTPLSITFAASAPWRRLEASTPALRLLTPSNLGSVLTQLLISVVGQLLVFDLVRQQPWWEPFQPGADRLDEAGSYEATSIFYFSMFQYVSICVIFAQGPPFREHFYKNVPFLLNVFAMLGLCLGLLFCPTPLIIEWAKFLPLHGLNDHPPKSLSFSFILLLMACVHAVLAYATERLIELCSNRLSGRGCAKLYAKFRRPDGYHQGTETSPEVSLNKTAKS